MTWVWRCHDTHLGRLHGVGIHGPTDHSAHSRPPACALPATQPPGAGGAAWREFGEDFEEREHVVLGEHGFEGAVADVAKLEVALGIGDLGTFTP